MELHLIDANDSRRGETINKEVRRNPSVLTEERANALYRQEKGIGKETSARNQAFLDWLHMA